MCVSPFFVIASVAISTILMCRAREIFVPFLLLLLSLTLDCAVVSPSSTKSGYGQWVRGAASSRKRSSFDQEAVAIGRRLKIV